MGSQEFKIDKENMNNLIKFNSSGDLDDISSDSESQASQKSNGAEEKWYKKEEAKCLKYIAKNIN